jgi:hypothetical protein
MKIKVLSGGNEFDFNPSIELPSLRTFVTGYKLLSTMAKSRYSGGPNALSDQITFDCIGPDFRYHRIVGGRSD